MPQNEINIYEILPVWSEIRVLMKSLGQKFHFRTVSVTSAIWLDRCKCKGKKKKLGEKERRGVGDRTLLFFEGSVDLKA